MDSLFETVMVVGFGLWIVLAGIILRVLWSLSRSLERAIPTLESVSQSVHSLRNQIEPVATEVTSLTRNAGNIVERLDEDVQEVGKAMRKAGEATSRVVDLVEERVADAAALVQVAQQEAEETLVAAATVVRGLRNVGRVAEAAGATAEASRRDRAEPQQARASDPGHDRNHMDGRDQLDGGNHSAELAEEEPTFTRVTTAIREDQDDSHSGRRPA